MAREDYFGEIASNAVPTTAGASSEQSLENTALVVDSEDQSSLTSGVSILLDGAQEDEEHDRAAAQKAHRQRVKQTYLDKNLGILFDRVQDYTLKPIQGKVIWDDEPELLCSYSWGPATAETNTIYVPGEPGKWQSKSLPATIKPDQGFYVVDENYARDSHNAWLPVFAALSVMNSDVRFNETDVIADSPSLRKLFEFARGANTDEFRLDVHLVHNTLIITRVKPKWYTISKPEDQNYGHGFEKTFAPQSEELPNASNHYRVIRYRMGPVQVACRFEADAYDDGQLSEKTELAAETNSEGHLERPQHNWKATLQIEKKGHEVPASQIVELKTQLETKLTPVACQDQLWFGRVSKLYTGGREKDTGAVTLVSKNDDTMERLKRWEENHEDSLRKLVNILLEVRETIKSKQQEKRQDCGIVLVRDQRDGVLCFHEMIREHRPFNEEFTKKFWGPDPGLLPPPRNRFDVGPQDKAEKAPRNRFGPDL